PPAVCLTVSRSLSEYRLLRVRLAAHLCDLRPIRYRSLGRTRAYIKRDREARFVRNEGHRAVPEVGGKENQLSDFRLDESLGRIGFPERQLGFAELQPPLPIRGFRDGIGQRHIVGGTDPPLRMNMICVEAIRAQQTRPRAHERELLFTPRREGMSGR